MNTTTFTFVIPLDALDIGQITNLDSVPRLSKYAYNAYGEIFDDRLTREGIPLEGHDFRLFDLQYKIVGHTDDAFTVQATARVELW